MPSNPDSLFDAHLEEIIRRSSAALERSGFDSLLVHAGEPVGVFRDDTHYPYRPHAMFRWWLPLLDAPGSVVLLQPGYRPRVYFRTATDFWHQPPVLPETGWPEFFDVIPVDSLEGVHAALPKNLGRAAWLGDTAAAPSVGALQAHETEPALRDLWQRLEHARSRKTGYEIACLRTANEVAARGHLAARDVFLGGGSEFDIHQAFLGACGQREMELPYNAIVAVNEAAAVLHYQVLRRSTAASPRSLLLDAGASCRGYGSDITRTSAASAETAFASLIESMDRMQQSLATRVTAGVPWQDIHQAAVEGVADILSEAGIVRCGTEEAVAKGLSRAFFPHGIGHMLGLQVHDVAGTWADEQGTSIPRPPLDPALRLTRRLEPGFVVTLEPGLYFIEQLLRPLREDPARSALLNWPLIEALQPLGGVRIEDDLVVTDSTPINLTREAFAAL